MNLPREVGPEDMRYPPFQQEWLRCGAYEEDHMPINGEDQEDPPIAWCGRTLYVPRDDWWVVVSKRATKKCGTCKTKKKNWTELERARQRARDRNETSTPMYDMVVSFDGFARMMETMNMEDAV